MTRLFPVDSDPLTPGSEIAECRRILYGRDDTQDWLSELEAHDWLSAEELGSERDGEFEALERRDG